MRTLASLLVITFFSIGTPAAADSVGQNCAMAASTFLASLSDDQRSQAVRPFGHEGRKKWTNLPGSRFRDEGLPFGEMTEAQRILGHRLIQCGLSSQGYQKATGIMRVDDYLVSQLEDPTQLPPGFDFGHGYYWLGIFGDPTSDQPWGWQLDGHHLGLNFTVNGDAVEVTPAFIGVQPNEVPTGPYAGWRILGQEEDKAIALVSSLDDSQRARAVMSETVPDEIFTGPERGDALTEMIGLPASDMTEAQRNQLQHLIEEYVRNMEPEAADPLLARIAADGPAGLHFVWMGGTEAGDAFYYRIHSPSVLIEFDHTLNLARIRDGVREPDVNHIHTVMRQPGMDYGADLLRRHYEESHAGD
ncbi:MAG: DUF3500 domain-containing protein [Alphaproteobacteria bacterium]|nr:DUF3500 domain-containing protein [Alphaproteobacteria bacterium]